jgi:hypothetical protein
MTKIGSIANPASRVDAATPTAFRLSLCRSVGALQSSVGTSR